MNKKTIGIIITSLIIGTLIVLTIKSNLEETVPLTVGVDTGLDKGNSPPDFELSTLSGEVVKLSDLKGKKVILNFWASWCGPCKAEMPHMENYYKKNKEDANVEIVAVNLTSSERKGLKNVKNFIDSYGLTFPIPMDPDGKAMDAYKIITVPTTYLIGTDGRVEHTFKGPMDEKTMESLVDNLK